MLKAIVLGEEEDEVDVGGMIQEKMELITQKLGVLNSVVENKNN